MSEWLVDPAREGPEQLGVSPWLIPASGQGPLLDNQVEESVTDPIEFKDKVQGHAGWIEILLPYVVSSLVLGGMAIPSVLHRVPTRSIGLPAPSDHAAFERVVVPDLQLSSDIEEAVTEPRVAATADGPAAVTTLPAAIDRVAESELPQQPPEPPIAAVPQAPQNLEVR